MLQVQYFMWNLGKLWSVEWNKTKMIMSLNINSKTKETDNSAVVSYFFTAVRCICIGIVLHKVYLCDFT